MAIEIGRAHFHQLHAAFPAQKASQRELKLGIGQEEEAFSRQGFPVGCDGTPSPLHQGIQHRGHLGRGHTAGGSASSHPVPAALDPEGIGSWNQFSPAGDQGPGGGTQKGLGQKQLGAFTHGRQLGGAPRRQAAHRTDSHAAKQIDQPIFHRIGQGAGNQQLGFIARGHEGRHGHQGLVFPLGEGGFNPTAAVIQHRYLAQKLAVEPLRCLGQIQLDHLTRAGTHQKEGADFRPAGEQLLHEPIELLIGIGQTRQIPLAQDRCTEAGFRKDHHARSALHQVGAGAGSHHQKERIGHAPMQPNNRGEAAEHLPLTTFLQNLQRRGHLRPSVDHPIKHWISHGFSQRRCAHRVELTQVPTTVTGN